MTKDLSTAERGIRIAKVRLILHTGEAEEYAFDTAKLNILLGVRNSSKTTTLRVIDYCLGDRGTPVKALNAAVEDKYQALSIDVRINGQPYAITRYLTRGSLSKVYINDEELTADAFSNWILAELGWANLNIPLGLNPATAPSLTPLSFRNTLRHIYRDEGSWISFASKEQEFMRQAVVSQLLGYAPQRYDERRQEFDLASATRQLDEAQTADRQAGESSLQAVTAISHSLSLPLARSTSQIADARDAVTTELAVVRRRRQELTGRIAAIEAGNGEEAGSPAGYDTALTAAYQELTGRLKQTTDDTAGLREVLAEHQRSARMVEAEIRRMERLS